MASPFGWRGPSLLAVLAGAVNLHNAVLGGEVAGGRHFLHQRFDVRAQEFERLVAALADEVEMPRMAVGRLKAESPFAEIHFPRHAGILHPLEGAVDRGAADAMVVFSDEIDEVVSAQMPGLAEEHADDLIALARTP